MKRSLAYFLVSASIAVGVVAQTATVQLAPSRDNTLYEDPAGAISNGQGQYLFVGTNSSGAARRALLAFDVAAAVPARSRVVDVRLTMVVRQSSSPAVTSARLHRATTLWGEGASIGSGNEGGGAPALVGDATWIHAVYPTVAWTNPGGDYLPPPSSVADMPTVGSFAFEKTEAMLADVQDWLDGQPNFGWLVRSDELVSGTARRIDSSDNLTATALVPMLTVTFLPPGGVASFGVGCATSGTMDMAQTITGPIDRGTSATLTVQSGVPLGLFVTLLSYDVLPVPLEPATGCFWWLRPIPYPILGIRVQDPSGTSVEALQIPNNPNLFGIPMALQSVMVDWAHPRQWALSNANLICIR